MTRKEQIEKAAENQAFKKGVAHTLRDQPAWHYSLIDFTAGAEWADANSIVKPKDFYTSNQAISVLETDASHLTSALDVAEKAIEKALIPIDMGLGLLPRSPETRILIEALAKIKELRKRS